MLAGAVAVVLVLVAGGVAAYFLLFRDDAPPPVSLSTGRSTTTSAPPADDTGGTTATTAAEPTADGAWEVATGSFAGYRVQETFAGFAAPVDAVGRSSGVTGSLTVEGAAVPEAAFEVDMTQLQSDAGGRDSALETRGLETATFPTASFRLTEPIDLGEAPGRDEEIEATASGELTLHGVTNEVDIPIQAVWSGERIEVVGSTEIAFADYGIEAPTTARVVSIDENGTLEFQLFFERAA